MKSRRWLVFGILGLVMAVGLTGCIITGATPNMNAPVVVKLGNSMTFSVVGPEEKENAYKYEWWINGYFVGNGKHVTFVADIQQIYDLKNDMKVECRLLQWRFEYIHCGGGCPGNYWKWDWFSVDMKVWNICIVQDAPVWQGDYLIEDDTDLQSLKSFTMITGSLEIYNPKLTSLAGLESLTSVGGDLDINWNLALTTLSGLENVTSVGGDLNIESNYSLTSLSGLENITSVGGGLDIGGNYTLTSLSDLQNLTSVGGGLVINWNTALTSLSGLENITSIGGSMCFDDNAALTSLGMTGLQRIGGDFSIYYNLFLCKSLAEELKDQVEARGGIGGTKSIHDNKDCTMP